MKSFRVCLMVLAILSVKQSRSRKFELILSLTEYFKSKFILFVRDENSAETTKKFIKNEKTPFVGIADLERNFQSPITPFRNSLLIIDSQEKFLKELSHMEDLTENVMSSVIWVVFASRDVREKIRNVRIPFHSVFLIVEEKMNNCGYDIFEIYEIGRTKHKIVSRFGSWENGTLELEKKDSYYSKTDLQGHRFNVSVSIFPEKKKEHEQLWHIFSEKMNFSIHWIADQIDGDFYPNGSKTGVFKAIEEQTLDGTPSNFVVTNSRLQVFDFIWPTSISDTKIYIAVNYQLNWTSFIAPFKWSVWLALVTLIVLISIVMQAIRHLKGNNSISSEDSLFNTFRAVFCQAGKIQGRSSSFYISCILPYVLAVVIVSQYSGTLQSFLTVKNPQLPFDNLEGVVNNGKYKIVAVKVSYAWFYIQSNNGEHGERIKTKLLLPPSEQPVNTSSGFRLLCNKRRVYVAVVLGFKIKENCDIQELSEPVLKQYVGIIVRKGFPYANLMTKIMKRLRFGGLIKGKWKNIIDNNKNLGNYESLSLREIFPILLLLAGLICLSATILLGEIMISSKKLDR